MQYPLLDGSRLDLTDEGLPCIIHGTPKAGASAFSIALIASMVARGNKVLFWTLYPMGRELLGQYLDASSIEDVDNSGRSQLTSSTQVVALPSGNFDVLGKALTDYSGVNDRIVFLKNFEHIPSPTLERVLQYSKIILAGDATTRVTELRGHTFSTWICFSPLPTDFDPTVPPLRHWQGYFISGTRSGRVELSK